MDNRARLYIYWLPPILWAAVIFVGSSNLLSSEHTRPIVASLLETLFGHLFTPSQFNVIHYCIRKAGHLFEYSVLAALLFRAIRAGRTGWKWQWALAAIAIAALYAATDEFHQIFVPGRSPSVWDVLIDTTGAALAQVLFFRR